MGLESLLHLTGVDQPVAQTIEAVRVQGRIRERLGERYRLAKECPCAFILAPRPQRAQVNHRMPFHFSFPGLMGSMDGTLVIGSGLVEFPEGFVRLSA